MSYAVLNIFASYYVFQDAYVGMLHSFVHATSFHISFYSFREHLSENDL